MGEALASSNSISPSQVQMSVTWKSFGNRTFFACSTELIETL